MIIINCFFFCKVIYQLRGFVHDNRPNDLEMTVKFTSKLKWYPIVQIVTLLPGTINRVFNILMKKQNFELMLLQAIFDYSSGLLFALVYGLNPTMLKVICRCVNLCCCNQKEYHSLSVITSGLSDDLINKSKESSDSVLNEDSK